MCRRPRCKVPTGGGEGDSSSLVGAWDSESVIDTSELSVAGRWI